MKFEYLSEPVALFSGHRRPPVIFGNFVQGTIHSYEKILHEMRLQKEVRISGIFIFLEMEKLYFIKCLSEP